MLMGQWIVLNHRTRGEGKPPSTKTQGPGYDGAEERAFRYQNRRGVHGECGMCTTRRFRCCAVGYPGDDDLSPAGTRTDHRTGGAVTPPEHER